jgi:hypothetical protein
MDLIGVNASILRTEHVVFRPPEIVFLFFTAAAAVATTIRGISIKRYTCKFIYE